MESYFFDSINHDRMYDSSHFAKFFGLFAGNGVFADPADSMMAMSDGGMNVRIRKGDCFINGRAASANGDDIVTLSTGDGLYSRFDLITVRLDFGERDIHPEVIEGTADKTPIYPNLQRNDTVYDIALAAVCVCPNVIEITQADITDLRQDTDYCGIVTGMIEQIDAKNLFAQYRKQWEDLLLSFQDGEHVAIVTEDNIARSMARRNSLRNSYQRGFLV